MKSVFFLGRPGSGKTTLINRIVDKTKIKFPIYDDYLILEEYSKSHNMIDLRSDGNFMIKDISLYDKALKELNNRLLKNQDDIVFVEFSRSNYLNALDKFSKDVLSDSLIFYIDCDFEECLARNQKREHHNVPEEVMKREFESDDILNINNVVLVDSSDEYSEKMISDVVKLITS